MLVLYIELLYLTGQIVETKNFAGSKTVSDFVKAGGTDYKLIFDNCHDASGRMMKDWIDNYIVNVLHVLKRVSV